MSINACSNCYNNKKGKCKITKFPIDKVWSAGRLCDMWRNATTRMTREQERRHHDKSRERIREKKNR